MLVLASLPVVARLPASRQGAYGRRLKRVQSPATLHGNMIRAGPGKEVALDRGGKAAGDVQAR